MTSSLAEAGADGLVKLWTVQTNECIATYDQHEDKVWALTVGRKMEMLATGGSDAFINLWHDSTASDKVEAFRKEEEGVLRGQELENALSDADYSKAIQLAFELHRPHKLFELFAELCRKRDAEEKVEKALRALGKEEFHLLLEYVREWNTKPKLCHIAQFVLFRVFSILAPTEIIEIKGVGELLEGLIPYSQRHFSRIDRLQRSTYLLDYTLAGMSVIEPETGEIGSKDKYVEDSTETAAQEQDMEEPIKKISSSSSSTSSRKRKSQKSGDAAGHKKVKGVSMMNSSAVSMLA